MKRTRFVPPRLAGSAATAAQPPPATGQPLAVFDCLFTRRGKRGGGAADGTLVLVGSRAQLLDLALTEHAAGALPPATAAALHTAHAGSMAALAAGQPLGPLWGDDGAPEGLAVDGWRLEVENDRGAAVRPEEWALRQRVAGEAAHRGGKPKDAVGGALPADSLGARLLAGMGWRPGQGLGRQPGSGGGLVLPALKWDKAGLGASAHIKRLAAPRTVFRKAAVAASGGGVDTTAAQEASAAAAGGLPI